MDLYIATRSDSPDILKMARARTLLLDVLNYSGATAFKSVWMLFFRIAGISNGMYTIF